FHGEASLKPSVMDERRFERHHSGSGSALPEGSARGNGPAKSSSTILKTVALQQEVEWLLACLRTLEAFVKLFKQREKFHMSVAQLTPKGQILVPKNLRRRLGLKPGGKVHLAEDNGRLILTPVP